MVQLHRLRLSIDDSSLIPVLDAIRAELELPSSFPDDALAQAQRACDQWSQFVGSLSPVTADQPVFAPPTYATLTAFEHLTPSSDSIAADTALDPAATYPDLDAAALPRLDATHIPFVTIDPEGSRDLDQAVHFHRIAADDPTAPQGAAVLVTYAIASLATFVPADSALDTEVRTRGLTVYMPDHSTPLHPPVLSEGAASLLPGQVAPACVWQILLDSDGHRISSTVRRAIVQSRAQLTYTQVDQAWRTHATLPGAPADLVDMLEWVGRARRRIETERGGVSAPTPEQEITRSKNPNGTSRYSLEFRASTECEEWNAQISLLTGMCAAEKMREAGLAILRTVPPADQVALERMRTVARLLGVDWPDALAYSDLVPRLDPADPQDASFLLQAMSLYRGAAYQVFRSGAPTDQGGLPDVGDPSTQHAAIAAEYGHATAPLRRLVDRWTSEICLAHDAGAPIPQWLSSSIDVIPDLMAEAAHRASAAERAALAATSAKILSGHEGEVFRGVIIDRKDRGASRDSSRGPSREPSRDQAKSGDRGRIMVANPAVIAEVVSSGKTPRLPLGDETDVTLALADVEQRRVSFTWRV